MAIGDPPLTDIAGQLRLVADRIDRGEVLPEGGHAVLVVDGKAGDFTVSAFGEVTSALVLASLSTAVTQITTDRLRRRP